jgi:hypothetical protein
MWSHMLALIMGIMGINLDLFELTMSHEKSWGI